MTRKKEIKVESHDEWRDRQIAELTDERFNIITHDLHYALSTMRDLECNIGVLQCLMSEQYKNNVRKKFPNGDVDKIVMRDVVKCRDKVEANLICLEPALNSVKQIERLPTVGEIVRMIEDNPDKQISLL